MPQKKHREVMEEQLERRGRKPRSVVVAGIKQTMDEVARSGARYIREVVDGKIKKPSYIKVDIAKFAIEHYLGKPSQKLVLPTDSQGRTIIPYSQLIILATESGKEEPEQLPAPEGEVIDGELVEQAERKGEEVSKNDPQSC